MIPAVRNADTISVFLVTFAVHSIVAVSLWTLLKKTQYSTVMLAILFFVPRIILFPMMPWLSDDVFGYLWYGHVTVNGMNPFAAPADSPLFDHLRNSGYQFMAYKQFPAIYPPLAELWFALGVWIGQHWDNGWIAALMGWKSILFLMEVTTFALIIKARTSYTEFINRGALLFVLSPLPVIEIIGQAHNEGLIMPLIMLLVLATTNVFKHQTQRLALLTGVIIGAMAAIKIYPIVLILPYIAHHALSPRNKRILCASAAITVIAISAPFLSNPESLRQFIDVLQFYNRTSFNSAPLHLLREVLALFGIEQWWIKAPTVLTFVRIGAVITITVLWHRYSKKNPSTQLVAQFFHITLAVLLCFTMLSPKIHTWYFVPIITLNIITAYQSVGLWTTLQMATYSLYLFNPPKEYYVLNYILLALMFIMLAIELHIKKHHQTMVKISQC